MGNLIAHRTQKRIRVSGFGFFSKISQFYKAKISQMSHYCMHPDKHKTALAIASAVCIGITPLFGFTFILTTVFGLVFRLNQFIMQGVHILVSPLQMLLFFPFMEAGKSLFGIQETIVINFKNLPEYIYNHSDAFIHHYLQLFLAGTTIWILVSVSFGYCIYSYIRWRLGRN